MSAGFHFWIYVNYQTYSQPGCCRHSRIETNALLNNQPPVLDFAAMAKAQAGDSQIWSLQFATSSPLVVEPVPLLYSTDPLFHHVSTGSQRPLVPLQWWCTVFDLLHNLTSWHPSYSTAGHITLCVDKILYPMSKSKSPPTHSHTTLSFPYTRCMLRVDLVGPLLTSKGYTYLLTCVDRYTQWPEAIPLSSFTAEAVPQAFLHGWISRFGVPSTLVTDHGWQFESRLWQNLMSLLGSQWSRTTAYHRQANGMVERFHR